MFISDFSIRQPVVTIVLMLALVAGGLFALGNLQTDEFPEIDQPVVAVAVAYPGASPEEVEREVVDPIEDAIAGLSGIDQIQSTSLDGFAQVIAIFQYQVDSDQAMQEIRDELDALRGELPAEAEEPILNRFDPNDQPIVSLTLASTTLDAAALTRLADPGITGELSGISGAANVTVVGSVEPEMTVLLDPGALQATGVSVAEVVGALQAQNLAAPVGRITTGPEERTIRLSGRLEDAAAFEALVVAQRGARLVRLGEVATLSPGSEEQRSAAYFNGREAIGIDVTKARGFSTTSVAQDVIERAEALAAGLPEGTTLEVVRDAGTRVEASVDNVQTTLLEGAALTVLVVFLFLNSWRSTVITGLALPVSLLAAFIPVWMFGFTLNTMSLLGLSLAIGILIDDAIVVRENIVRHVEMGSDHRTAAHEGTDEIGLAVTATTFSIVVVFVPIGLMPGIAGQFFQPFAITIAAAVLVSLLVSFSLDPMLSAYWPEPHGRDPRKGNLLTRTVARFNDWFDRQAERYKGVIAWALDHRKSMVALTAAAFVGALALQGVAGGVSFVPTSDRSELTVEVEAPPGATLDYTARKAETAARIARSHPSVSYTYTTVGGESTTPDEAQVYVRLLPKHDRDESQEDVAVALRRELAQVGGASFGLLESGVGGAQKPVQIQLRGPDAGTLTRIAEEIAARVRDVPGTADVTLSTRGQKPELDVEIDRGLAGSLGLTVAQVAQALRPAFAGVDVGDWVDPDGETRDVQVRLDPAARTRAEDLRTLPLVITPSAGAGAQAAAAGAAANPAGAVGQTAPSAAPPVIPLGQVATVTPTLGPAQVDRLDRERVVTIGANIHGRDLGAVSADVQRVVSEIDFPAGYGVIQGGDVEAQTEVFGAIGAALAMAILLMYLVLVIQFRSFLDPVAILASLPLSLIGVVVALIVTGDTLNLMSLIGVILLMGIVAKNAILLIDFAKMGRENGMELREALIEAGRVRLRPIIMTSAVLVISMIPVALGEGEGADFRAPLGRAVIGGTITSTILTLLVIPTMYEILDGWRETVMGFVRRRTRHPPAPRPEPEGAD